ncbi:MAG: hypothetical protein ABIJ18_00330 [archaeon]
MKRSLLVIVLLVILVLAGCSNEPVERGIGPDERVYEDNSNFLIDNLFYFGIGLVGVVVLGLIFIFRNSIFSIFKKKGKNLPAFKELMSFVREAVKEGNSNEHIIQVLVSEGWPKKEVGLALDKVHRERQKKLFGFIPIKRTSEEERIENHFRNILRDKDKSKDELQKDIDEAMDLKEREEQFMEIKKEIKEEVPKILTEEVKRVLRVTDDLLGKMPENMLEEFVHSADFGTYKKVMKKVHEPVKENDKAIDKMDKVLTLLEKDVISKDEARRMLGFSKFSSHKVEKTDKKNMLKKIKESRKYEN